MKKHLLSVILVLSAAISLMTLWPSAAEVEAAEDVYRVGDEAESGDDLLLKAFYGEEAVQPLGEVGITPSYNTLNPYQQNLYNWLRRCIQTINMTDVSQPTEFTLQLGSVDEARQMWNYAANSENIGAVLDCLISDLPADLYWYERSAEMKWEGTEITIRMGVGLNYRAYGNEYMVSGAQIRRAHDAISKVVDTVLYVQNRTDYEKLSLYCALICELVDYNDDAMVPGFSRENIDPWQFVYVFDMDPETNVVCEGYSKAFQLLCDLTDWEDSSIHCFTVDGTMNGGGHMWNIVQIQGQNYMVDVTNCDEGLYGYPDKLFLVGGNGSVNEGYYPISDSNFISSVLYRYDSIYADASILRLSSRNYTPSAQLRGRLTILENNVPAGNNIAAIPGTVLEAQYEPAPGDPSGPISYQWYVNGYPMEGETNPTFLLVGVEAGYSFSVRITMHGYSLTSAPVSIIEAPGLHGRITVSSTFPSEEDGTTYTIGGETVTLHAIPDSGFKVGSLQVVTANGANVPLTQNGNDYVFTMPTADVNVQATFVRI